MSEIIRNLRKRHYLTQADFAKKIGVTQGTVSQWEHGIISPNSNQLRAISEAFGISIDTLVKKTSQDEYTKLTDTEIRLINAFRDADPSIREAALTMLENSALKKGASVAG